MITARYIDEGKYIIGDEEYGLTLCRVDFSLEMREQLTEEQLESLANDIRAILITRLNLEEVKNDSIR